MKIEFVRTGGFAGLRLSVSVETDDMPESQSVLVLQRVEAARAALTSSQRSRPGPDQFEYKLTIDEPQRGRQTLVFCEPDVPEEIRPLIDELTIMARRNRV